jgi:hypothetical protein
VARYSLLSLPFLVKRLKLESLLFEQVEQSHKAGDRNRLVSKPSSSLKAVSLSWLPPYSFHIRLTYDLDSFKISSETLNKSLYIRALIYEEIPPTEN